MPLDGIENVRKVTGGALYTLWTKYGQWDSEGPLLFEKRAVQRAVGRLQASVEIDVPAHCFVLKLSDADRSLLRLPISDILIRDDYVKVLNDIIYFSIHRTFQNEADGSPSLYDDVENPFINCEPPSRTAAVMLVGHPGIGKSLWQFFGLVLRVLAGRPTIYQAEPDICYVFNADGLYEVNFGQTFSASARAQFYDAISSQFWCLVDCSSLVIAVHPFLSELRSFLVQSASPRNERVEWAKKYHYVSAKYYMKPWSLPELITGLAFQASEASEADLEVFCERYAPSARKAYANAHPRDLQYYEEIVATEIAILTYDALTEMMQEARAFSPVSHHLLLIGPGSSRTEFAVIIVTRSLYGRLCDHLQIRTLQEAAKLYQVFVRNSCMKGSAGYILDDVHDLFCKGGEWEVTPMKKNKAGPVNTHFKSPGSKQKASYMRLGYNGQLVTIVPTSLPGNVQFATLTHHRYLLNQNISLRDGYYQPSRGQPTFDSFIYEEASKTATMLQMTVATHHDVKTRGVEWLITQGVRKFRLIAVIPPDTLLDLPIPIKLTDQIKDTYQLVVDSLPVYI